MAAEAVALLKDFYAMGNPKGVLSLGAQADAKWLSSCPVHGILMSFGQQLGSSQNGGGSSCRAMQASAAQAIACPSHTQIIYTAHNVWVFSHAAPKPHRPLKQLAEADKEAALEQIRKH